MKPRFLLLSFFLFAFSFLLEAYATIRYVSKTGSSTPPYTSWLTASDSIQKCIDYAVAEDTIYVGNGIYKEKIIITNKFLTLIGSGWDSCIVDSKDLTIPADHYTIYINGGSNLKGFCIKVADNHIGIGIVADNFDSNSIIHENRIEGADIGIFLFNSHLTCSNNIIFNVGKGIRLEAFDENYFPVIENNIITTVYNSAGIQGSFGTSSIIRNNYVISQEGGSGYDLILYPKEIKNNLVIKMKNSTSYGFYFSMGNGIIENNLASIKGVWGSGMGLLRGSNKVRNNCMINGGNGYSIELPDAIDFKYNSAWNTDNSFIGFSPDITNITLDPMVVSEDSSDFHLQLYSPLINAGDPAILDKDSSRSDIGLYGGPFGEVYTYKDIAPKSPRNLVAILDTEKIALRWNKNTEADTNHYNIYRDTTLNFTIDTTKLIVSQADTLLTHYATPNVSRYVYKITCVDNQGNESIPSEEILINLTSINDYPTTINNYVLYQNYPNPFNSSTNIGYKLKERGHVKLSIYDIKGEIIEYLVNDEKEAGYYEAQLKFNEDFTSGVYLYKIDIINHNQIPVFSELRKMVFIK